MLRKLMRNPAIPDAYRSNFTHLYFDIAWFSVLSGSAINFQSVYAARLGATGWQIGLLGALPALINLALSIPSSTWLEKRPIHRSVFLTSALYRLGFLFWILLPWLFSEEFQVWGLIGLVLVQAIPLTAMAVGMNALFAAAVPPDWRAHVAGTRNVLLSITYIATSLVSGYLLHRISFPLGYQIVFGIGFLGALMSSMHLYFVKPLPESSRHRRPVRAPAARRPRKASTGLNILHSMRPDIWRTPFRGPLLVMLVFHFVQYLSIPVFPLFFVRQLHLTDEQIGLGTALFYITVLLGSSQLVRLSHRLGHHRVTGLGAIGMSIYPILLSFCTNPLQFYIVSTVGGFGWAMLGGAYANYLLEKIPANDRPAHLAWYNIILNTAILSGSLLGSLIAGHIGLGIALLVFGIARLLAGVVILRRG